MIIPKAFKELLQPARYKVYYGGRGSSKSWSIARVLLLMAAKYPLRILCAREFQSSIADSVHQLLSDQIDALGLTDEFNVGKTSITSKAGANFLFKGIRHNIKEIKSTENVSICWIEEAESVSAMSWDILTPTIRAEGSEIWITFNPLEEDAPTYQRFVVHPAPDSIVKKVSFRDNPHFPATLEAERLHKLAIDPDGYLNVWEGEPLTMTDAIIFKGRYIVDDFETPPDARFFYGADWGFANDPTTLNRCFVQDGNLYIDYEAHGVGVELDEIGELFQSIPGSKLWPIKADSSRPETVSYVRRTAGYKIQGAKKWAGCVEDGIEYLRSFTKIIIHTRCPHTAEEFRRYSYNVDKQTGDILPIIVDAWNHHVDGIRYSLDGYVRKGATAFSDFAVAAKAEESKGSHAWKHLNGLVHQCEQCGIAVRVQPGQLPQDAAEKQGYNICKFAEPNMAEIKRLSAGGNSEQQIASTLGITVELLQKLMLKG